MKILRISLRNIASLAGEHTVDFTKDPLAHVGLFSISGPTGSGKSTLLDALCLALYDETPRMAAVAGTVAMADAKGELQQNDVRTLLRRGCGEGFAEVAFVGVDGCAYTARWEVHRAKSKADRALQKTQHFLWKGNTPCGTGANEAAAGTPNEIRRQIEAKVGLSFDQFRRAVLLAQGDFATFLKARDADRAEILQALTGTERFEKISAAIYARTKQEETAVQMLRDQIGAAPPLSDEARAQADRELARADEFLAELQHTLAIRGKQLEWFRVETEYQKKLGEAAGTVSRWSLQVEKNEPKVREIQWIRTASIQAGSRRTAEKQAYAAREEALRRMAALRERDAALLKEALAVEERHRAAAEALEQAARRRAELAPELAKARALDGEVLQLEHAASLARSEHARAQELFQKAENELSSLTRALANFEKNRRHFEQKLLSVGAFEPFARETAMWMERFELERRLRTKKEQLAKRVDHTSKQTDGAAAFLEKARAALPSLRALRDQSENNFNQASIAAAAFDPEQLLAERRNATALQKELQKLKVYLADQQQVTEQRKTLEGSLHTLQEEMHRDHQLQQTLSEKSIPESETRLVQARQSLRLAEAAASNHTALLRQALVPGQACLVCGSSDHPHAAEPMAHKSTVLRALEEEVESRERVARQLREDLATAGARIVEKTKQVEKHRQDLKRLQKQAAAAAAYSPDLEQVAALLQKPAAQRDMELARQEADTAGRLHVLDMQDEQRIRAEQHLRKTRELLEKASHALQKAERDEGDARNAHSALQVEHANARSEWNGAVEEHSAALGVIHAAVCGLAASAANFSTPELSGGKPDYVQNPEAFCRWFEAGTREHQFLTQQIEQTRREENGSLGLLGKLTEAAAVARETLNSRSATLDEACKNLDRKKVERSALLGGRPVTAVEQDDSAAYDAAVTHERRAGKEHADFQIRRSTHLDSLEQQEKLVLSLETSWCEARDAVDGWLRDFAAREGHAIDRGRLDDWLNRDAHTIEHEQQELDAARQCLSEARGVEAAVRQQLESHWGTRSTMDDQETIQGDLRRLSENAKAAQDAAHAKRAVVLSDEERKKHQGELAKSLEAQIKQADPWQKLNQLIGSADGARFRNIAQQWTLEILLRHANAQLALLSGRYRLERLRDSLNLLVTDREMDGQQRSVHSLSGGESFLVSLGLALGLASLTSSRLRIESLFIDEGFGSLDSETLRVALNALSHLESQGRKVGVISHVSEMVDAIPVQVRVVRGPGGASKIVV